MPHIITDPRHQRLLAREFGIKGMVASPSLESTIQPVAVIANPESRDAFSDAPFFRRFSRAFTVTGDATHHPQFALFLRAPGNMGALVRQIAYSGTGTSPALVALSSSAAIQSTWLSGYFGSPINQRLVAIPPPIPFAPQSAAEMSYANNLADAVGNGGSLTYLASGSAQTVIYGDPSVDLVLVPGGNALLVLGQDLASTMYVGLLWDEFPLEPGR